MQRRRKRKNKYYSHVTHQERQPYQRSEQDSEHEDLSYVDTLPEVSHTTFICILLLFAYFFKSTARIS